MRPISECRIVSTVNTPSKASPIARGIEPARKRNPVAPINSALETLRARRYIATGGDQIELKPPRAPENNPMLTCHFKLSPNEIFAPNIWLNENATMANPIEADIRDFGNDMIKRDVRKMLTIIERPKSQYFFAIWIRFSHPKY